MNYQTINFNNINSIVVAISCVIILAFTPVSVFAQDHDSENEIIASYSRPDYKVYKSLSFALSQPDSVYILVLKGKRLRKVPEGILKLPNLMVLDLSKNKLDSIPEFISQITTLVELDFSANKLQSIPKSISNLQSLQKLSLNRNLITHLPPTIGDMVNLQELELWDNELETLPDEIRDLKKLQKLELRGILFSEDDQMRFHELLPHTQIYMSPPCDCKNY